MKKRSGIYFYSILIATWGLTIRQVGNFIQFYAPRCPWQVGFTMQQLGWVGMISGFSMDVQLYVHDRVEKVQVVTFAVQDIILSCLYLRAAYQYLQGRFTQSSKTRSVMCLLLLVQFVVIAFDVAIVFMDFAGYLQLKFIVFSFAYAVKLELEFVALNQLVELSKMGLPGIASMSLRAFETDENDVMVNKMPSTAIRTPSVAKMGPGETSSDTRPCAPQSSSDTLDFITTPGQLDA
ncbi:unnamed protein product [Alternaria sp. RS040]